jgi:V8-like Glu-specific endopeptidase
MLNCPLTRLILTAVSTFALLPVTTGTLQAQGIPGNSSLNLANVQASQGVSAEQYWTPERLSNAKPMEPKPTVGSNGLPSNALQSHSAIGGWAPVVKQDGAPPSVQADTSLHKLLAPHSAAMKNQPRSQAIPAPTPEATSSFGAYFTTSQVFPDDATTVYPYSTAGKLYFSDLVAGGDFVCSASVLRPRVIVTAGHCVASPSTNPSLRYFYGNFLFIPAYNYGYAPFGTWTPSYAWVTNEWFYSDGSVPNAQDVGMLVPYDYSFYRLGDFTGWLGYYTGQLYQNHVTMLGYPCNLDFCEHMEQTTAQNYEYGGNNTEIYGSAMRGGASGGPWIQDFGIAPYGAPGGLLGNNYLVAVTSYGPISTVPQYLGASNLDQRFLDLLSDACSSGGPGSC